MTQNILPDIPPFEINPGLLDDGTQKKQDISLSVDYQYLAKAWFYPVDQVVAPPPSAAHSSMRVQKYDTYQEIFFYENYCRMPKPDKPRYRTYLNRWRYYANEVGIQPTLKLLSFLTPIIYYEL